MITRGLLDEATVREIGQLDEVHCRETEKLYLEDPAEGSVVRMITPGLAGLIFLALPEPAPADPLVEALGSPLIAPANAGEVQAMCDQRLAAAERGRRRFEALPLTVAPAQAARAYDDTYGILWSLKSGEPRLLNRAHPDSGVRDAGARCIERADQALDSLRTSRPAYQRLLRADNLPGAEFVIRRQLDVYRRNGVERSPEELTRLAEIRADISRLALEFERNIEADARSMTLAETALTGLPPEWVESRRQADGNVVISNIPPDVFMVARYSPDRALRRRAMAMFFNRGEASNAAILARLLERRAEMARLLGFRDYASYDLQPNMAQSPENAEAFLGSIAGTARERASRELARLLASIREDQPDLDSITLADFPYANRRLRSSTYRIDSQTIRQYLPFSRVRDGIFALAQDLYGIEIRPVQASVWHPSVTAYDVVERGTTLGRFFLDPHPRAGKPSGNAWAIFFRQGVRDRVMPMAALLLSMPEDTIEHGDLVIFLHELGHVLHHLFAGNGEWTAGNLFEGNTDIIEAPSQMLEEWAWDYETLRRFAVSNAGEVIPEQLVLQMQAARHEGLGLRTLDDIGISNVSLALHRSPPSAAGLGSAYRAALGEYSLVPEPPEFASYASFTHLASYGAGYYSYIWSRALAADWLSEFQAHGLHDPEVARRFRRTVLEPGGSRPMADLTRDFLGRDWSPEAYKAQFRTTP